jgi:hypothetical protein
VDPELLELVSRSVAYVTWKLANDDGIGGARHRAAPPSITAP